MKKLAMMVLIVCSITWVGRSMERWPSPVSPVTMPPPPEGPSEVVSESDTESTDLGIIVVDMGFICEGEDFVDALQEMWDTAHLRFSGAITLTDAEDCLKGLEVIQAKKTMIIVLMDLFSAENLDAWIHAQKPVIKDNLNRVRQASGGVLKVVMVAPPKPISAQDALKFYLNAQPYSLDVSIADILMLPRSFFTPQQSGRDAAFIPIKKWFKDACAQLHFE